MRRVPLLRSKTRIPPSCDLRVTHRSTPMLDVLMLALAFGLFAAAIGYTYTCERL
jgi:hypothetical protein